MANVFDYLDWRGRSDARSRAVVRRGCRCAVPPVLPAARRLVPPEGAPVGALMRQLLTSKPPLLLPEDGRFIPSPCGKPALLRDADHGLCKPNRPREPDAVCGHHRRPRRRAAFCRLPRDGRHARRLEGGFQHGLHLPRSGPAPRGALCRLGHAALSGGVPARRSLQGRQPRGLCRSVLPRSPAGAHRSGV